VDEMFEAGWVNEVELLLKEYSPRLHPFKAIGYREIVEYLNGDCTLDDCIEEIKKSTRNYAKRQLTWFRKEEYLQWYDISKGKELVCMEVLKYIEDYYLNGS
jgi:tRNA dimethylallyltransferase